MSNAFRELSGSEKLTHLLGSQGFAVTYMFFLEFDSDDVKKQLPDKLELCLQILMKRHPLLRACVRQQPQSQPPRYFFCELQPTGDGDVKPVFHIETSSDWQAVLEGRIQYDVDSNSESLWSVVYLPNVTSPFERLAELKPEVEAGIVLRFSHTIIDGQSKSLYVPPQHRLF